VSWESKIVSGHAADSLDRDFGGEFDGAEHHRRLIATHSGITQQAQSDPTQIQDPRGLDVILNNGSIARYASVAVYELNTDATIIVHLSADRPDLAGQPMRRILQ